MCWITVIFGTLKIGSLKINLVHHQIIVSAMETSDNENENEREWVAAEEEDEEEAEEEEEEEEEELKPAFHAILCLILPPK